MKVYLATFATEGFRRAQALLNESALRHGGVDEIVAWGEREWRSHPVARECAEIATAKRGAGYWLWKPVMIAQLLERVGPDDIVIYHDSGWRDGYRFTRDVAPLADWVRGSPHGFLPGCYIAEYGPSRWWTKRDCFVYMGCDEAFYWDHPQVQATFSLWRRTEASRAFLAEWLAFAKDPRILTDAPNTAGLPNLDGFVDHRHDQSIITNLVLRHAIPCFGDPHATFPDVDIKKNINFLTARIAGDRIGMLRMQALFGIDLRTRRARAPAEQLLDRASAALARRSRVWASYSRRCLEKTD
jgi:hypothetical protein